MDRVCQNPDCNKDISHRREMAKYCSNYCGNKMFAINNRERCKEYDKRRYQKNKEKIKMRVKQYVLKNPEKVKEMKDNYYKNNIEKIKIKKREYYENNKHIYISAVALRKARELQATPKWADLEAIKEFYKNKPKGYEVDHIYPLTSKIVCGLHVIENLQYLTMTENRKKGNKVL